MFWAWERPEDLRGLAPAAGVAFLRATVEVSPSGARVAPRRQPLRVDETTWRMAVVRVEFRPRGAALDEAARAVIVSTLARVSREPGIRGVQLDLDAPRSMRADHRRLLAEARTAIAPGTWLSMTALASWCEGDAWLAGMAVDEVVPMVFSMGVGGDAILRALRSRGRFASPACAASVGWADGESTAPMPGVHRSYVFSARPWTPEAIARWVGGRGGDVASSGHGRAVPVVRATRTGD